MTFQIPTPTADLYQKAQNFMVDFFGHPLKDMNTYAEKDKWYRDHGLLIQFIDKCLKDKEPSTKIPPLEIERDWYAEYKEIDHVMMILQSMMDQVGGTTSEGIPGDHIVERLYNLINTSHPKALELSCQDYIAWVNSKQP